MVDKDSIKDIDLVMAAIHYLPNHGHYPHGPEDLPYLPETLLEYWHTTLIGITSNPAVDILAHPARLPGSVLDLDIFFDDILNILTEAAKLSVQNNIAWEINNLTCTRIPTSWIPQWHKTIQAAIDQSVKITFGSDAHSPIDIAKQNYVQQMLKDLKNLDKLYSPLDIINEK
jgi:histidinol phosphatase-like PHP family hydrolase